MLQQLWNGLTLGAIYGFIAIGYTLIFGIIQVIFFAQGELSMLAAFAALAVLGLCSGAVSGVSAMVLATVAGLLVSLTAGVVSWRLALRPLRAAPRIMPLITSLGVSIVLQNAIMLTWGPQPFPFRSPINFATHDVAGVHFSTLEVMILVSLGACALCLHFFLKYHRYGLAVRAIAQSPDGARLMGMSIDRAVVAAFLVSSATAAVAGIFMALYYGVVKFNMGFVPGIKGFTIAVLGGIGNLYGALVAGLLVGVAEALFAGYVSSDYRDLFVFAILVLTLVVRPQGLLGEGK